MNNTEAKIKHLGVDEIQTVYAADESSDIKMDSLVIFTKSGYLVLFDFAINERSMETIKKISGLADFEEIDDRLYIGRRQ
jgi:hypothetical protein